MTKLTVGVVRESADLEQRVGLTPDGVARLRGVAHEVAVEAGAGRKACFPDETYRAAGANVLSKSQIYELADVVVCVQRPASVDCDLLRPGQVLLGLLQPFTEPHFAQTLAEAKVTVISLDGLPRTLSRAQSMDALSSQANVAGYKAALLAANAYGSYFPMFMTAAGTTRPARVLVIGAGVAGLQAIGTARRLGAVVTGYDMRDAARADVLSTGATFLELGTELSTGGDGGYARELSEVEARAQQEALDKAMGKSDVVITTAQVPGRRPPVLVSGKAIASMESGSVVIDLASSALGGNVEGSEPESTIVTKNGITLVGAGNLASDVPRTASTAYS